MKEINGRKADYPVLDIFLKRHSPRAMSSEALKEDELMTLFEAARWAPSSSNRQPWKFIYAKRETSEFEVFLGLLEDGNREWCIRAGALIVLASYNLKKDGTMNGSHSFDAGSAWENLALQATEMSLVAHSMSGFDHDMAREKLEIPQDYTIEAMIALGRPGSIADLSEKNQARETPNQRKEIKEIVSEGKFAN